MLKFTKMEGIGNDYIYIDGIHQDVPMNPHFITKIMIINIKKSLMKYWPIILKQ